MKNAKAIQDELDAMLKSIGEMKEKGDIQSLRDQVHRHRINVGHACDTLIDLSRTLDLIQKFVDHNIEEDDLGTLSGSIATVSKMIMNVWTELDEDFRPDWK